ncbi:MAG: NADPH-dependent F420 reductase [Candidatus Heimdallarchaeota archaeon]
MNRKIGLIPGTGKQSKGIALRLAMAGYSVILGSRTKEKAVLAAKELSEKIPEIQFIGESNEEVVKKCNLLFFAVPYQNMADTIEKLKPFLQPETILVDVIVPLIFQAGLASCSDEVPNKSVSEYLQTLVPEGITVVGGFKTISASKLNKIDEPLNVDLFLTGDNKEAKQEIKEILSKITGLRPLDAGPLSFSRTTEQMTALVINLNKLNKLKHGSFRIITS